MRRLVILFIAAAPAVQAATYPLPRAGEQVIGDIAHERTSEEDTLVDVARRHRLGYEELVIANPGVDRWLPGEGTPVVLPTRFILPSAPREGIVVNIPEFRLYYFPPAAPGKPRVVETYAISAGREDWKTPRVTTVISQKLENPAWYPPASIRQEHAADGRPLPAVVPPGPDNPLGPLALKLGIPGGYFIHGTSKPLGIGMPVTHGCLRLYPEDMAALFRKVEKGTPVRVINEPYKTGWKGGMLYVEAHPPRDENGNPQVDMSALSRVIDAAARRRPGYEIDWSWVDSLALQPRGVPVPVPRRQPVQAAVEGTPRA